MEPGLPDVGRVLEEAPVRVVELVVGDPESVEDVDDPAFTVDMADVTVAAVVEDVDGFLDAWVSVDELVGEELVLALAVSAWATPVPLASAAPMPTVRAPVPSQAYGSRPREARRCRPFVRFLARLLLPCREKGTATETPCKTDTAREP